MANIIDGLVIKTGPIKNGAGLHGSDIGTVFEGYDVHLFVDLERIHDGWVPITGPSGLGPTWKLTGQQGWVELTHLTYGGQADREYRLITDATTGAVKSCTQVR